VESGKSRTEAYICFAIPLSAKPFSHDFTPMYHYHFTELPSTNDKAAELARTHPAGEYLAVTADAQTSGRGRNGKIWHGAARENLYCSIAVRHDLAVGARYQSAGGAERRSPLAAYQAIGALSALEAIRSFLPPVRRGEALLKYPNDAYMETYRGNGGAARRKVCGVLVEHEFIGSRCAGSVIGIGVNVRQREFPRELENKASSLLLHGIDASVAECREALLAECERLLRLLGRGETEEIFRRWWKELRLENAPLRIGESEEEWRAEGLDGNGLLLTVNSRGERHSVHNGESVRRLDWE
jgi:BirA family biotin operon repressor/biotin-[acetyl-CoA-carboxylase] ligase